MNIIDQTNSPWNKLVNEENGKTCYGALKPCVFNKNGNKKIFLIGDSHATTIAFDLKKEIVNQNDQFTYIHSIFFPGFKLYDKKTGENDNNYYEYNNFIRELLSKEKNSTFIFLMRYPLYLSGKFFDNQEGGREPKTEYDNLFRSDGEFNDLDESFINSVNFFAKHNKIILVYPIPEVGWWVPNKLKNKFFIMREEMIEENFLTTSYDLYKKRTKKSFNMLNEISKNEDVLKVLPHEFFCNNKISERCLTHDDKNIYYVLEKSPAVTGEELVDAQPTFDQNGQPAGSFRFNPGGARKFGNYTANNVGALFAIVLDGEVISAPQIREAITGGSGQITGNFSVEESAELSILLRAGALPAPMQFEEERTIGPELGQDSIDAGKIACLVAFVSILIFMFLSYGLFGIFVNIALIINVTLIFGLLSIIGATLTLPGIAGIVLTIGMAVDANVLVFERIKEELKTAKSPYRAIELGYERAFSAILDANITTFIAALILFLMGSGPVRGFSITLGLGIITSVFTAIYVTRLLLAIWFDRTRPKTIVV